MFLNNLKMSTVISNALFKSLFYYRNKAIDQPNEDTHLIYIQKTTEEPRSKKKKKFNDAL